jgi:hypothetical protein
MSIVTSFDVPNKCLGEHTNTLLPYPPPLATGEHGFALTFLHVEEPPFL